MILRRIGLESCAADPETLTSRGGAAEWWCLELVVLLLSEGIVDGLVLMFAY